MKERTKHRAIGAGVLALAAAAILPLVLESAPPEAERSSAVPRDAPPRESVPSPSQIRIAAISGDGGVPRAAEQGDGPDAGPRLEGRDGGTRAVRPAVGSTPAATPPRVAASSREAGERPKAGWAVQIGSFADPRNARNLRDQLASRGFEVFTQRVTSREGKSRVRVLAGPDGKRSDAAARLSRLRQKASIDGFLVRYPG